MSNDARKVKCTVIPDDPVPLKDDEIPSPWVSSSGDVAHPDSPMGAGGQGHFRIPGTIDGYGKRSHTIPQPKSLRGKNHVLSSDEETALEKSKEPKPKKNPPPVTTAKTFNRKAKKNKHNVAVDLEIKILNDLNDHPDVPTGYADTGPVTSTMTAGFEWADVEFDNATNKVTKIAGKNVLSGVIELQIRYAKKVKPDQKVAYGRGTKEEDKTNGDITIGFHEHCHLNDWWNYLTKEKLPLEFEGKVGMTTTEYQDKQTELEDKFQDFLDAGDTRTVNQTDEVGDPTQSEYLANK